MNCVYLFGEKIYKNKLRGVIYEEELNKINDKYITYTFDTLSNKIIEQSKRGIKYFHFNITCKELQTCDIHRDIMLNGVEVWKNQHLNNIISKSYITIEDFTKIVIYILNDTFPYSEYTIEIVVNILLLNDNIIDF